jgi:hypothetical protein
MQHTIPPIEFALDDDATPTTSAFLVAVLQWAHEQGVWQPFARLVDIDMKTVVYSPLHKVQTLIASIIFGCQYNHDINHRLVPDQVAATLLGLERFPDQSQCNLLLRRLDAGNLRELEAVHAEHLARYARHTPAPHEAGYVFVDIDQCGLVANGKTYELSRHGYFPRRRGEQGYQLSAAWLGRDGLTLALRLDPGNSHCSTRLADMVELSEARALALVGRRRIVYRMDAGYGGQPQIRWLLASGRLFLVKSAAKRADKWAARVPPGAWQRVEPGVRVAEVAVSPEVRGILCAVETARGKVVYSLLLTNLPAAQFAPPAVWQLYGERQTIEAFFKTGRQVYGIGNLRSREFTAIDGFLWLVFITHNLLMWAKRDLLAGSPLAEVGTRDLVEKVGRLAARRVQTGQGWRLLLPPLDTLARWLVQALSPQWVQLPLPLRL